MKEILMSDRGEAAAEQGYVAPHVRGLPSWLLRRDVSFMILCVIPVLIYSIYILALATPRYSSEFRIQIKQAMRGGDGSFGPLLGLTGFSSQASDSGNAVIQYLKSADSWDELDRNIEISRRYSAESIDWLDRLEPGVPIEKARRYWLKHLDAHFEATTGTVVVSVSAFSPADAYAISNAALTASERLVNAMTDRSRRDSLSNAEKEVGEASAALERIEGNLLDARNRSRVIDPGKQVSAAIERVQELRAAVDRARAELAVRARYLAPGTPGRQIAEAQLRIAESALSAASSDLTSREGNAKTLSSAIEIFSELEMKREFAAKRYEIALANLNSARIDVNKQQLYLDTIVRPRLPEEASFPKPLRDIGTFLGLALAAWVLLMLIGQVVKDHI